MSQFDATHNSRYVEKLRSFLHMKKQNFKEEAGLKTIGKGHKGRLPSYPPAAIEALEDLVNKKAALSESRDTSVGERYRLARDYQGLTDSDVSRAFGVSRELIRRWSIGLNRPTDFRKLAEMLDVPLLWLEYGEISSLPANSHLGVRVGKEGLMYREMIREMTKEFLLENSDMIPWQHVQTIIEFKVMTETDFASAARRAGGRWQVVGDNLYFAPWIPLPDRGLTRRYWSDEVEAMIEEELTLKPSVYAAWHSLKLRCEEKNLAYPKMISLHKRIESRKKREAKFGIEFNLS